MLLFGLDIPLWVVLLSILLPLLYWYGTNTFDTFKKMGLPYPRPLPFIGNLIGMITIPLHEYEVGNWKKLPGKVHGCFQGRLPVLDVTDVDFIKQVTIKEFSSFTNRRDPLQRDTALSDNLLMIKDDHWKHVRSTLTPTFTSGKLKQMHPVISECADVLVEHLAKTETAPVAIKAYAEGYTMDVIARTAFGMEIDVQGTSNHPFIKHAKAFFGLPNKRHKLWQNFIILSIVFMPKPLLKLLGLFTDMGFVERESIEYFQDIIDKIFSDAQSQLSGRKDFVSMCAEKMVNVGSADEETIKVTDGRVWSNKGLTKRDIAANAFAFFSAGYETTASTLQYFLYNMATNPTIQEKLYNAICEVQTEDEDVRYEQLKNLELLDWCINETLRIFPAIIRVDRVASKDITINGLDIPEGMIVNILIYVVHHDPEYWPDPEKFDPDRFSPENLTETQKYAFLGFGAGNRSCIASRLAMLELRIAIVKLMKAFRFEKSAETPEKKDLKFVSGLGLMQTTTPIKLSAVARS